MILEPRNHRALPFVIGSAFKFLPDTWQVWWFHGTNTDLDRVKTDKRVHPHIDRLVTKSLDKENLTISDYNNIFTSQPHFWEQLPANNVLIFQSDVAFHFDSPHFIEEFMAYDYVGAPWPREKVNGLGPWRWSERCGNGGMSFRKRDAMLKCLHEKPNNMNENEDVYFSHYCRDIINVAPRDIGRRFSFEMEHLYPNPMASHKGYAYHPSAAQSHLETKVVWQLNSATH